MLYVWCYVMLYYNILCYMILYYIMVNTILYYIILYYITLYYIILHYIMLCYVISYYIILYYIIYNIFLFIYNIIYVYYWYIHICIYPVYTYGPDFLGACEATQDSRRTSLPLWHVSGSDKRSCSAWRYLHPGKNMERACITFGRLARMRYLTNTVHLRSDTEIHHHERELHVKRPRPSLFVKVSNRVWDQF
jgi:hypothetical protein